MVQEIEETKEGKKQEIRLGGSGGQGIIMAAIVLAEAAGIFDGCQVSQTQSYGPEARGGVCKAEVVISDAPIDYPKVTQPEYLLAMNQASVNTYFKDLKESGLLIVDSTFVDTLPTGKVISIPFTKIARERFGTDMVANMVALGALVQLSGCVSMDSVEAAVRARVPAGTEDLNINALRAGVEPARAFNIEALPTAVIYEEE
ncbi:MAG: 2-oxoacid:acceptor oxidoreductase family protein [Syntrophales bacterium]|nr:2-oxoacid:acceptor oxidoreductase family protein [Syntrophales bacterium]